jgi:hypothetical protein
VAAGKAQLIPLTSHERDQHYPELAQAPTHPQRIKICPVCHSFVVLLHSHRRMAIPACRPIPSLVLCAVLLAFACTGCGTVLSEQASSSAGEQPTAAPSPHEEMRDLTLAEKSLLAEGFTAGLDDPDSVKFRWAKVPNRLPEHAFEYCGLIDIGAIGGHTDTKPFLATIRTENGSIIGGTIAALNSDNREENRGVVPKLCRQKGLNPLDAK